MEAFDLIVVGGGISGLALAAQAVEAGWRVRLFEAAPRAGGCIRTHRSTAAPGFWLELGAHTCFNSYGRLLDLASRAGLETARRPRRRLPYRLWLDGHPISPLRRLEPFGLLAGAVRLPFLHRAGNTVEEYFGALSGRRNYRRVVGPALEAVACQPVAGFPADYLFRPKPRRKDVPRSFTYPQGLRTLAEAMAALPGVEVRLNTTVREVDRTHRGFSVRTDGEVHVARRLALALPPPEAARLLTPIDPELAAGIAEVAVSDVDSVGVVVRSEEVSLPPLAGLIGVGQPFYSVVSRDVVPATGQRGFTFHFRPGALDSAGRTALAADVLGVSAEQFVDVVHTGHTLPTLDRSHPVRVAAIDTRLRGQPLALAGNWFGGLSLEDCALRAAAEVARLQREAS